MRIEIEKSPLPVLWLDTSVISKIAKSLRGVPINESDRDSRHLKLFDLIRNKSAEGKLIVPKGDQFEEIELFKKNNELYKTFLGFCDNLFVKLSRGASFAHREQIRTVQRQTVMKAFINSDKIVRLNFRDVFHPSTTVEFMGSELVVAIPESGCLEEIDQKITRKAEYNQYLENARQQKRREGLTYETELEREYQAPLQALDQAQENFLANPNFNSFSSLLHCKKPMFEWEYFKGNPPGIEGLRGFIASAAWRSIPYVDIECKLFARILTCDRKIDPGDMMDISQLAAVIPYCSHVLTDRGMKNLIMDINVGDAYGTRIYSMRDFESFMYDLSIL